MPIVFEEKTKQFHLYNDHVSYILRILPNKQMGQVYFGKKLPKIGDSERYSEMVYRDMSPVVYQDDISFSLDQVKQECSIYGKGDLRQTALNFEFEDGSHVTNFQYDFHEIFSGKRKFDELPAIYTEDDSEVTSLWVILKDQHSSLKLTLQYSLLEKEAMITRSCNIENTGKEQVKLESALSLTLDLPDANYQAMVLTGAWCRERTLESFPLHRGIQQAYSLRGHSSHQYNPFLALKRPECTENSGEVLGFSLIYSGNFLGQIEVDNYNNTRVLMGIHPTGFSWRLKQSEAFQTPEVAMVYSNKGLTHLSQTYHRVYRQRLIRGSWREKSSPILINNWEATYMDFNQEKLMEIAKISQELGIELFVIDDGWFGKRNNATTSLGDWYPNLDKLPNGLNGISQEMDKLNLKLGLWFEPEMISEKSQLFIDHPDWVLGDLKKTTSVGRYQYYLDLSKKEVVSYLFETMAAIIEEGNLSYIKWDLNRSMSEVHSQEQPTEQQGMVYHKAILGMYKLHELLLSRFPELLIESCASGGARFDPGMLYYAPQGWVSDNTDAVDRLKIQYGTSLVYPISSMGSHVSAVPNHQTNRTTSIDFRGDVACFGTFGYELDLTKLTTEEKESVKRQIRFMKDSQQLIHNGLFYRLKSPFEGNLVAWMVMSSNQKEGLVGIYRVFNQVNGPLERLVLSGLAEETNYQLSVEGYTADYYGAELMSMGLPLAHIFKETGDFVSKVLTVKEKFEGNKELL